MTSLASVFAEAGVMPIELRQVRELETLLLRLKRMNHSLVQQLIATRSRSLAGRLLAQSNSEWSEMQVPENHTADLSRTHVAWNFGRTPMDDHATEVNLFAGGSCKDGVGGSAFLRKG